MTVVEYFDNTSIENIATALFYYADEIIYFGPDKQKIDSAICTHKDIFGDRIKANLKSCIDDSNNLENIIKTLQKIVDDNDEVVFDLEGGKELFLLAAGIVYNQNKQKVRLHRIDINKNQLIDAVTNKVILNTPHTYMTVEENVKIYGGDILEREDKTRFVSSEWEYTDDLKSDILLLFNVYKKHLNDWTDLLKEIQNVKGNRKNGSLEFYVNKNNIKKSSLYSSDFLSELSDCGAILNLTEDKNRLSFTYKNKNINELLSKEGNLLETYVTVCAKNCRDNFGESTFVDARTGIVIAWNEHSNPQTVCVTNEIDVALMKGLIPIFISCKSGTVKADELYKLNSVAFEFGNKYVKKVLVASTLNFMGNNTYKDFIQRANELDIKVIELDKITSLELELQSI